nr:alkene reductase [Corynebacterium lactis]
MPAPTLFDSLRLGRYELPNRVTMAPLTRCRAEEDGVPLPMHATYYAQRASAGKGAGLIVTEGAFPAFSCRSFRGQPGIANEEQQSAWATVADAVHAEGGTIFMQIMHGGRTSHPDLLRGARPQAPSALGTGGPVRGYSGKMEGSIPEAMTAADIERVRAEFVSAARRAIDAGLDGVEIHSANGYLLHQFLSPAANVRTDGYGGSPSARARLTAEIIRDVANEIGADRTAVRISPEHNIQGALETDRDDVVATYSALFDAVSDLNLAYVSILHAEYDGDFVAFLRDRARGLGEGPRSATTAVILNSGFAEYTELAEARRIVEGGLADAVAVGRELIANPDLALRWQKGLELNVPDPDTFYLGGERGYTDYPFYSEE